MGCNFRVWLIRRYPPYYFLLVPYYCNFRLWLTCICRYSQSGIRILYGTSFSVFLLVHTIAVFYFVYYLSLTGATDWCLRWKRNGWKTINGTEVKNKDEFQKLSKLCDEIDVKWVSYSTVFLGWLIGKINSGSSAARQWTLCLVRTGKIYTYGSSQSVRGVPRKVVLYSVV